ncbi:MAG: hypothetical protein OXC01_04955 [Immundisolibacterales bacterium]|nr:hypothetical protein [Immundisolibacterales bacterium]
MTGARPALAAGLLALAAGAAAPGAAGAGEDQARDGAGAPLRAETRDGPVVAEVTLSPAEPRLGDRMTLSLSVEAEPGVRVEMPSFGDALGRFTILDFTPREETGENGGPRLAQRYTLQATASGRHRVPRLRLEFTDERPGRGDGTTRELLTEELAFDVASVLPEDRETIELRPARPPLAEPDGSWLRRNRAWLATLAALSIAAAVVAVRRRRAPERARAGAFERASARLARLRGQGLPEGDRVDPWYVELSDIVRRYVEERFALRAPELTTEEFLFEAGRSAELSSSHRGLLSDFLERCDRVKFARYTPGADESRQAFEVAERFLAESRAPEDPAGRPA